MLIRKLIKTSNHASKSSFLTSVARLYVLWAYWSFQYMQVYGAVQLSTVPPPCLVLGVSRRLPKSRFPRANHDDAFLADAGRPTSVHDLYCSISILLAPRERDSRIGKRSLMGNRPQKGKSELLRTRSAVAPRFFESPTIGGFLDPRQDDPIHLAVFLCSSSLSPVICLSKS